MAFSTIRVVKAAFYWTLVPMGCALNALLIFLIRRHTPLEMRVYSRILLQTSVCDILILLVTLLSDQVPDGASTQAWLNGVVQIKDPAQRHWLFILWILFALSTVSSIFGFVGQFMYRYLVLNRNIHLSLRQYFGLLCVLLAFPAVYIGALGYCFYPREGHEYMTDPVYASLLGFNLTEERVLVAMNYSTGGDILAYLFYYNLTIMTLAILAIIVLGCLMHRFVKNRLSVCSSINNRGYRRALQKQRQLTRTLVIQALLSTTVYIPILMCLVPEILPELFRGSWSTAFLYQYQAYFNIFLYLPAAIDPIVTLALIGKYRRVVVGKFKTVLARFRSAPPSSPPPKSPSPNAYEGEGKHSEELRIDRPNGEKAAPSIQNRLEIVFSPVPKESNNKFESVSNINNNMLLLNKNSSFNEFPQNLIATIPNTTVFNNV